MKVELSAKRLIELGIHSMQIGTQDKWIPIAIEWIEAAEKEIQFLKGALKELK